MREQPDIPEPEIEPDVPDWSKEPRSDDLLARALEEAAPRRMEKPGDRERLHLLGRLHALGFGKRGRS